MDLESFMKEIVCLPKDFYYPEVIQQIEDGNPDYYLLCREFVKYAIRENSALFVESQLDSLKKSFQAYISKYPTIDPFQLFSMIKRTYDLSVTDQEVFDNTDHKIGPHYIMVNFDFDKIPDWGKIEKILKL